jgi:hypothetical protein
MVGCARESRISYAESAFTSIMPHHLSKCDLDIQIARLAVVISFLERDAV